MSSNSSSSSGGSSRERGGRRFYRRPRTCRFCGDHSLVINWKNRSLLDAFVNPEGKIRPRRQTGTCARHQRGVAIAIKRARHMATLNFAGERLN
jgi:small subunit ribosomal protein S18